MCTTHTSQVPGNESLFNQKIQNQWSNIFLRKPNPPHLFGKLENFNIVWVRYNPTFNQPNFLKETAFYNA